MEFGKANSLTISRKIYAVITSLSYVSFRLLVLCPQCLSFSLFMAGNKVNNIDVVYTPWSNLKKTASMDVGQVGFHNSKMVNAFYS